MCALIRSSIGTQELAIDNNSYAARVTEYYSNGTKVISEPVGVYMLPINTGRITGATAANSTIWAMRNIDVKTIKVLDIQLCTGFDGAAAATSSLYNIGRFNTATPSGGAAMTVIKGDNIYAASSVSDARYSVTGLTMTSVVFETPFIGISNPRQVSSTNTLHLKCSEVSYDNITLATGEGIYIRLGVDAVVGDSISGYIRWMEIE